MTRHNNESNLNTLCDADGVPFKTTIFYKDPFSVVIKNYDQDTHWVGYYRWKTNLSLPTALEI